MLEPAADDGCDLHVPSFRPCGHFGAFGLSVCSDERHCGNIVQNNETEKEDELIFIRV